MSILATIALSQAAATDPIAVITARQLARVRRYLRQEGERIGLPLIEPDEALGNLFHVRVCSLALAAVTGQFDHDPPVISVVEEAQFQSRRVSIRHNPDAARIEMRLDILEEGRTKISTLAETVAGEPGGASYELYPRRFSLACDTHLVALDPALRSQPT